MLISIDKYGANVHFKHIWGRSDVSVASCTSCTYIYIHITKSALAALTLLLTHRRLKHILVINLWFVPFIV